MSTASVLKCAHCGRPIGGLQTYIGGFAYHYECTLSPNSPSLHFAPNQATQGAVPLKQLTEADVRRIVREEITKEQP